MENSKAVSDQLDEFRLNYIKRLNEEMLEGELIKRKPKKSWSARKSDKFHVKRKCKVSRRTLLRLTAI